MNQAEHVVVGILGASHRTFLQEDQRILNVVGEALQGAFVEHQAMLQKLSCKQQIVTILVRTVEDLNSCDALIIPGGGTRCLLQPKLIKICL